MTDRRDPTVSGQHARGPLLVALLELGHLRGRGHLGEAAREQVVAGEAARHADHVAAQANVIDVAAEDDVHQSETYGRRAISRARLTAIATCTWWRRHAPVMRRLRILPFSET